MIDAFGSDHAVSHPAAIEAFSRAVKALASHRSGAVADLEAALAAEPAMTAAYALCGLAGIGLATAERFAHARQRLLQSRAALARNDGGTAFERALVAALDHAVAGRLRSAADTLDDFLYRDPNAFVVAKLSHSFRFLVGDADGMLGLTARLCATCEPTSAGYGYLLGCHAFALEEIGRFHEAERVGREALAVSRDDVWALHAVAHVYEMRGQAAEGVAWLESHRDVWSRCNALSRHVAWHLALFALEMRDHDRVLSLYDRDIAGDLTGDFRAFADAASILWRLKQAGVDPGAGRWNELADVARAEARNAKLVFAQLHCLLALIGAGRFDEAEDVVDLIHQQGQAGADQGKVAENVGYRLAVALVQSEQDEMLLMRVGFLARRLHRIGGSHAQRDVFLRSLAVAAQKTNDAAGFRQVLAVRRRYKSDDGFIAGILQQTPAVPAARAAMIP